MSQPRRFLYCYAFVIYAVISCVVLRPLVWHLSSALPHDLGDPLLSTTLLWWNAHTVPLTDRWWDGFSFWPASGTLAFSDHRLGESLLASPLQWIGFSPVTAYNLTLLATFPLSAIAAHWAAFTVTRRHDAALLAGLAYAFNPYRVAHLQHLELLGGFAMPVALGALHRHRESPSVGWLALFTAALVVQGLCASYYLTFFCVFLLLWVLWFEHWRDPRHLAGIAIACAAAAALLWPIIDGFARIHAHYGFERRFGEVTRFSADITSLWAASPLLTLWGWTSGWVHPEGELFPGLTITVLAGIGVVRAWTAATRPGDGIDRRSISLAVAAAVLLLVAVCGWTLSPWSVALPGLHVSSVAPYKPFSLALIAALASLASLPTARRAFAARAPLAFYVIAAAVMFLCSFGPEPRFNGHQILYKPVYAWLMELPPFGSIRVPARFAMPAMLALALSGALAVRHLTARRNDALIALLAVGIIADSWMTGLPMQPLPDSWPRDRANGFTAVVELPLGDAFDDAAAMYRATLHGHPVLNGMSGFAPAHYATLRMALEEYDPSAFDGLPPSSSLLVVVDTKKERDAEWTRFLHTIGRARELGDDGRWRFFAVGGAVEAPTLACAGEHVKPTAAVDYQGREAIGTIGDDNPRTWWTSVHAQQQGDYLVLDLGRTAHPCSVSVAAGEFTVQYPRKLIVETSRTADDWTVVAVERTAGDAIRGALASPKVVPIVIRLAPSTARYIRLRIGEPRPRIAWVVTDVSVNARPEVGED